MLNSWIVPSLENNFKLTSACIVVLLIFSALSLGLAPWVIPVEYSWISHTTSQSAAQGLQGAWLARTGFLLFGIATCWTAISLRGSWARGSFVCHVTFGVLMIATAAYSHKPWIPEPVYDSVEDSLHSMAATVMGFGFSFGVLFRAIQRWKSKESGIIFDAIAISAATFIPMFMYYYPNVDGFLQRVMFIVAYLWYGKEAMEIRKF